LIQFLYVKFANTFQQQVIQLPETLAIDFQIFRSKTISARKHATRCCDMLSGKQKNAEKNSSSHDPATNRRRWRAAAAPAGPRISGSFRRCGRRGRAAPGPAYLTLPAIMPRTK